MEKLPDTSLWDALDFSDPLEEPQEACKECGVPINQDGSVNECFGECDREIALSYGRFKTLDFDDEY